MAVSGYRVVAVKCGICDNVQLFGRDCTLAWYECVLCKAKLVTGFDPSQPVEGCKVIHDLEVTYT